MARLSIVVAALVGLGWTSADQAVARTDEESVESKPAIGQEAGPASKKDAPKTEKKDVPPVAPKQDDAPNPAEKTSSLKDELKSLTDDLLDLVVGPKNDKKAAEQPVTEPGEKDPLENAIQGMRNAQKRISENDTGAKRDVQDAVIKDLEKLIEQAKQPPKNPPPSSQSASNSKDKSQSPQGGDSSQRKRNSAASRQNKSPQPDPANEEGQGQSQQQKQEAEKAKESSEEERAAREREADQARRRDLVKDVWGHLPPALRRQLLNISSDKSLPKYDDLVRRYFESLAEEGTKPPLRPRE